MGLLDNLYLRSLAPGDLPFRRRAGVVQASTLAPALHGMRVEIARVDRRLIPYALDFESGVGEGNVGRPLIKGYLPAPNYPAGPPPPTYTPPIYPYPPGTQPPPTGALPQPPAAQPPPTGALPPPAGSPTLPPGQEFPTPSAPGYRRAWNLQFTANTPGSSASQEIRVTPAIGHPFRVTQIDITPLAGVTVGQYIDILVVPNAELVDEAAFLGSSLFENPAMLTSIPVPDNQRGIAVPITTQRFENLGPIFAGGQQIKAVVFFTAPAAAMPLLSVSIVVEEVSLDTPPPPARIPPYDPPPLAQPPIIAQQPPAPPAPTPTLPPGPSGTTPSVPTPFYGFVDMGCGQYDITRWIPEYDTSGHITGYHQDPAQAAYWGATCDAKKRAAAYLASQPPVAI